MNQALDREKDLYDRKVHGPKHEIGDHGFIRQKSQRVKADQSQCLGQLTLVLVSLCTSGHSWALGLLRHQFKTPLEHIQDLSQKKILHHNPSHGRLSPTLLARL